MWVWRAALIYLHVDTMQWIADFWWYESKCVTCSLQTSALHLSVPWRTCSGRKLCRSRESWPDGWSRQREQPWMQSRHTLPRNKHTKWIMIRIIVFDFSSLVIFPISLQRRPFHTDWQSQPVGGDPQAAAAWPSKGKFNKFSHSVLTFVFQFSLSTERHKMKE